VQSGRQRRRKAETSSFGPRSARLRGDSHAGRNIGDAQVANAFVFVFGNLLLHFFDRYPPPYTFEQIAAFFMPMVFLLLTFIYGVLKVPGLVNAIFTGRSGDHALPGFLR
jgi:hypothetical protein